MFICLKSSNIEGNLGRSASYLISVDIIKLISPYGQLSVIKQHKFYTYIAVF